MKKLYLVGLLALLPFAAQADIIPVEDSITGAGPIYTWTYHATLTQDQNAQSGPASTINPVPHSDSDSFFTIYDFAGYVTGSCSAPSGWTCSVQGTGFTPDDVVALMPPDNPSVVNLTFFYTSGPTLIGPQEILGFSAQSTQNQIAQVSFTGRGIKNIGNQAGTVVDNVGNVSGPAPLPEPASLGLLGLSIAGLAFRRRKA